MFKQNLFKGVGIFKKTLVALCICCFLVSAALLCFQMNVVADNDLSMVSANTVEKKYVYNTIFYLPEFEFSNSGRNETSKSVLISPSNKTYDATKVSLNETGVWTVRFTPFGSNFDIGFTVYRPTYEVTSNQGGVQYGETSFYSANEKGLLVNIPKNSVFKYNDVINLSGLNKSQNVLEFGIVPNSVGVSDVGRVFVYLTDIYDKDNYIVYRISNPNNRENGYDGAGTISASFSGAGHFLGTESSGKSLKDDKQIDVVRYKVDDMYFGAYTPFAFSGTTTRLGAKKPITALSYDDNTKQVHSNTKMWYSEPIDKNLRTLIADLSKDNYDDCVLQNFQEGFVKPFAGFTTGEVYLSITAEDYSSPNCNLFIKSIYGADLSKTESFDKNAPNVVVDTQGFSEDNLPQAEINKPYKIFEVCAVDNELDDVRVFKQIYLYYKGSRILRLSIKDGCFTPKRTGIYEIVYSVTDGYGNNSEYSLFVEAVEQVENPRITFDKNIKLDYFVGENISVPVPTVTGGAGKPSVSVNVKCNGKPVEIVGNSFIAEQSGEYKIEYTAKDYNNNTSVDSVSVNVTYNEQIALSRAVNLPKAIINGASYAFDMPVAYYYENQVKKEILPVIKVDCGEEIVAENGLWTANTDGEDSVAIKYSYKYGEKSLEKTYVLPIVIAENLPNDYQNYFLLDGDVDISKVENGEMEFVFTKDGVATYAKDIPVSNLRIELTVLSVFDKDTQTWCNYNDATSFLIELTDVTDSLKKVVFSIDKISDTESKISVNGGKQYKFDAVLSENNPFTFTYYNDGGYVLSDGLKIFVDKFADGSVFNGFSDNRANLSFSTADADDFRILLSNLAGQGFFLDSDFTPPVLNVIETLKSTMEINSTIKTDIAYSVDVFQVSTITNF